MQGVAWVHDHREKMDLHVFYFWAAAAAPVICTFGLLDGFNRTFEGVSVKVVECGSIERLSETHTEVLNVV